jgi:hypothetical protein
MRAKQVPASQSWRRMLSAANLRERRRGKLQFGALYHGVHQPSTRNHDSAIQSLYQEATALTDCCSRARVLAPPSCLRPR